VNLVERDDQVEQKPDNQQVEWQATKFGEGNELATRHLIDDPQLTSDARDQGSQNKQLAVPK